MPRKIDCAEGFSPSTDVSQGTDQDQGRTPPLMRKCAIVRGTRILFLPSALGATQCRMSRHMQAFKHAELVVGRCSAQWVR